MGVENEPDMPLREFVGFIWIGDQPAIRICVMARTAMEARESVIAEYGEGHVISLRNLDDASRPRSVDGELAEAVRGGEGIDEAGHPCGAN